MGMDIAGQLLYGIPVEGKYLDNINTRSEDDLDNLFWGSEEDTARVIKYSHAETDYFYVLGYEIEYAWQGDLIEITKKTLAIDELKNKEIARLCGYLGIPYENPKFYLASYLSW